MSLSDEADSAASAALDRHAASGRTVAFCIEALSVGGAEQMLVSLANEFAVRGWRVHLVCLTEYGELAESLTQEVNRHVLSKRPGIDWRLPGRLRRLLLSLAPAVVNSHLWVANLWTRLSLIGSGLPVIVTEHSRDTWKPLHYRWLDRGLVPVTSRLVAVSEDTADFYRSEIGVPDRLLAVINNGVDTARYAAGRGRQLRSEWAPNSEFLVGTVGRLTRAKNHIRLLDAIVLLRQRLPAPRLVIVGDGPQRDAIVAGARARGLEDTVILTGARDDVPDVLAALDVFVLSSDREGHPMAALEAQAAGIPVVATRAGGTAEAIATDGDRAGGILVEKSAVALAEAVAKLAADAALRREMARFARRHARDHFDFRHMVDRYERLFAGI